MKAQVVNVNIVFNEETEEEARRLVDLLLSGQSAVNDYAIIDVLEATVA